MTMIDVIAWIVIGIIVVAVIESVHGQMKDRRQKAHEYRMKRLEYDEKVMEDRDDG